MKKFLIILFILSACTKSDSNMAPKLINYISVDRELYTVNRNTIKFQNNIVSVELSNKSTAIFTFSEIPNEGSYSVTSFSTSGDKTVNLALLYKDGTVYFSTGVSGCIFKVIRINNTLTLDYANMEIISNKGIKVISNGKF